MKTGKYTILLITLALFLVLIPSIALAQDYNPGQSIDILTTVKDEDGVAVTDATVTLDIYAPDNTLLVNDGSMTHVADGVYEYSWSVPETTGTYFTVATAVGYGYDTMELNVVEPVSINATGLNATEIWGENITGYTNTSTFGGLLASLGGDMIAIAVVGLLSLVVMIFGFIYKPAAIPMLLIAGVGWIVTGALILDNNPLGNLNTPAAILTIMLALTCFIWIYATVWLPRRNRPSREDKDYQNYEEKVRKITGGK